jgi:hypothetical protein
MVGIGAFTRTWFVCGYGLFWYVRAYPSSPWHARRLRSRAEAAVVANAAD